MSYCKKIGALLLLSMSTISLWAESMTIDGTIKNQNGVPIPGVEVHFENADVKDTTDSEGKWSVVVDASNVSESRIQPHISLENGILQGMSAQAKDLDVRLLNAAGQQVWSYNQNTAAGENWSLNLGNQTQGLATQNYFLAVQYGSHQYFYRVDATFSGQYVSPRSQSSALTYVECIIYRKQGQIITEDYVEYYKSIIDKYLYERNISGVILEDTLNRTKVDEVYAVFTGGKIKGEVRAKMGWSSSQNKYSGKIYIVKPLEVYDFVAITQAFDTNGRLIAQSDDFDFDSEFGDIDMSTFMAGNAFPYDEHRFSMDSVSINDSFYLFGNAKDSLGGTKILYWEYKWNGGEWKTAPADSVEIISPDTIVQIPYQLRYMDTDSNVNETDTLYYEGVVKDAPTGRILWTSAWLDSVRGKSDPISTEAITIQNDTITFSVDAKQAFGKIKTIYWQLGSTKCTTTNNLEFKYVHNDFATKDIVEATFVDDDGYSSTAKLDIFIGTSRQYCTSQTVCNGSENDAILFEIQVGPHDSVSKMQIEYTSVTGSNTEWKFESQPMSTLLMAIINPQPNTTITAKLFNDEKRLNTYDFSYNIDNDVPTAIINSPQLPSVGQRFYAFAEVYDRGHLESIKWSLDTVTLDANSVVFEESPLVDSLQVQLNQKGDYILRLQVIDDDGNIAVASRNIFVTDEVPVEFVVNKDNSISCQDGELVEFKYANEGLSEHDAIQVVEGTNTAYLSINYTNPISYVVRTNLNLSLNSDSTKSFTWNGWVPGYPKKLATANVNVYNDHPEIQSLTPTPNQFQIGQPVTLSASVQNEGFLNFRWDVKGDGSLEQASQDSTFSYTPTDSSEGVVALYWEDFNGNKDSILWRFDGFEGSMTDNRDNQSYKFVQIGLQTWMTQNINYGQYTKVESPAIDDNLVEKSCPFISAQDPVDVPENCDSLNFISGKVFEVGAIYTWTEALQIPSSCLTNACSDLITDEMQGVCPEDWHIADQNDWEELIAYTGNNISKLKSVDENGWTISAGGTDDYGLALKGLGYFDQVPNSFGQLNYAFFWIPRENASGTAYAKKFDYNNTAGDDKTRDKELKMPVRCVKNTSSF